jgi:hypothetical protein
MTLTTFILRSKHRTAGMKFYDAYDDKKVNVLPGWSDRLFDDGDVVTLESSFDLKKIRRFFPSLIPSLTIARLTFEVKKKLLERGLEEDRDYSLEVIQK